MLMTLGMAVANDFDGAYFTIQALRMYHSEVMQDCEIILVDNNPKAPGGRAMLPTLMGNARAGTAGVKYIEMDDKPGTTQSRNAVFDNASGDFVVCMDSHVMLKPGALRRLFEYYYDNPTTPNLYSGPMLYDNLINSETHFDNIWRDEMHGVWGRAWACPCWQKGMGPWLFTPRDSQEGPHTEFWKLKPDRELAERCEACGKGLPIGLNFGSHYDELSKMGYWPADRFPEDFPPFEIPAMGLGLFSCRKGAWLEFNRNFRGFGGEEIYIHEKYRQAGRQNICLPFLRWMHRFGRANGVPYRLIKYDKVRNYVLGRLELGQSLDPIREHFVDTGRVPQAEWEFLIADPVKHDYETAHALFAPGQTAVAQTPNNPSGQPLPPKEAFSAPETLVAWFAAQPRDLNEHVPELARLAGQVNHVTEFTERRESTIALFAGRPERLISYNTESDLVLNWIKDQQPWVTIQALQSIQVPQIEETDFLFLDSGHTYAQLKSELGAYAPMVKRWIALHDTQVYGNTGPDGGPGMIAALKEFLKTNPDWFIYSHTDRQYGLTVLGRMPQDKPAQVVHAWAPEKGPGTELKAILSGLGINPAPSCDCNAMAMQMDVWGPEGCAARKAEIVQRIKDNQARWKWQEAFANTAKASWKALMSGLVFKFNWKDPIPGLVDLAIHRAAEKEREATRLLLEGGKDGNSQTN